MSSPPDLLSSPSTSQACSFQKAEEPDLRGLIGRARQHKLDDALARRIERRRAKDQVRAREEAVRGEKSRLDSLASVEQSRELWRLRDEKSRENKRLRDEAGVRAGGAYKRPLTSQQATDPSAKKRLVGEEDGRAR
jgi:hypothetical protein